MHNITDLATVSTLAKHIASYIYLPETLVKHISSSLVIIVITKSWRGLCVASST